MEISYSIIIPHYNIPDLLMRCLKSIPVREDVQVIVVDDCSPDADTYLERYPELSRPYLEFYSTEKGGSAGRARNVGLKHAKGKWLIFADADDFFSICFNDILDTYSDNSEDVIFFNANSVDLNYLPSDRVKHLNRMIEKYLTDEAKDATLLRYAFGEPWCKIIKRSLIEDSSVLFEESPIHNDTYFSYMVGHHASNIAVDIRAGYFVTARPGSVSKQLDEKLLLTRMDIFAKKNRFLADSKINYFDPIFWQPLRIATENNMVEVLNQCYEIAETYGYKKEFIDCHLIAIKKAQLREARYKQRRVIIDKIKRTIKLD